MESFRLLLGYEGESDGRAPGLTLSVPTSEPPSSFAVPPVVRISKDRANKLIDLLTAGGSLDRAEFLAERSFPTLSHAGRRYGMTIKVETAGGKIGFHEDLGWGQDLLQRLGSLEAALGRDEAEPLGRLIEELRRWVEREAKSHVTDPVERDGLEFRAAGEADWTLPAPGTKGDVELSLRITNRSRRTLRFHRFDTVWMKMWDEDGRPIPLQWGRDKTVYLEPLVLRPGETQVIPRRGILERDRDGESLKIVGSEGTGGGWWILGLKPGRYSLAFTCDVDERTAGEFVARRRRTPLLRGAGAPPDVNDHLPFWHGEVTTRRLGVRVIDRRPEARATAGSRE